MVAGVVGALIEKSAIAWTIFFGVLLKLYFYCWRQDICVIAVFIVI